MIKKLLFTAFISVSSLINLLGQDVKTTLVEYPISANAGQVITIDTNVTNSGNVSSPACTMYYYINNVNYLNGQEKKLYQLDAYGNPDTYSDGIRAMSPDGEDDNRHRPIIPFDLSGGNYYIILFIDVTDQNMSNNLKALPIAITGKSDLIVSSISAPISATAGDVITIDATIKNIGQETSGSSTLKYFISSNNTFGNGDVHLASDAVGSLLINGISNQSATVTIPNDRSGSQFILCIADANNNIPNELNENNNIKSHAISIQALRPDLITESQGFAPSTVYLNSSVLTWGADLSNIGNNNLSTYAEVDLYLSSNNSFSSEDFYIGTKFLNSLDAGVSKPLTGNGDRIIYEGELSIGDYYVIMVTDPTNGIVESNENNNIYVFPYPNLLSVRAKLGGRPSKPIIYPTANMASIDSEEMLNIQVFPNPTTESFNLNIQSTEGESSLIIITDLLGKVIYTEKIKGKANRQIDMSSERNGMYILRKIKDSQTETLHLYKE